MPIFPVKTPKIIRRLFPNYIWEKASLSKTIYLTFDDGPTPEITEWTLSILKQYNAKATFFCIGDNINKYPDIFNAVAENGHSIGNHTFNHLKGWNTPTDYYIKNTEKTQDIICNRLEVLKQHEKPNLTYCTEKLFRPPFGKIKRRQAKKLINKGYKIVMWSIISYDWDKKLSPETCLKNIIKKTSNGSIIVLHDSIKASKNMQYVLPKLLNHFSKKGYLFKGL